VGIAVQQATVPSESRQFPSHRRRNGRPGRRRHPCGLKPGRLHHPPQQRAPAATRDDARLNRAIVNYQQGRLRDDSTVVLVEWQPDKLAPVLLP
jgi:hypothetical protein